MTCNGAIHRHASHLSSSMPLPQVLEESLLAAKRLVAPMPSTAERLEADQVCSHMFDQMIAAAKCSCPCTASPGTLDRSYQGAGLFRATVLLLNVLLGRRSVAG